MQVSPALTEPECADLTFAAAHVSTVRRRYRAHAYRSATSYSLSLTHTHTHIHTWKICTHAHM